MAGAFINVPTGIFTMGSGKMTSATEEACSDMSVDWSTTAPG
jgi:hypothetical protein